MSDCGDCGHDAGRHYTMAAPPGNDVWFCGVTGCGCENYEPAAQTIAALRERVAALEAEREAGRMCIMDAQTREQMADAECERLRARVSALERVREALLALLAIDTPHTLEHDLRLLAEAVRHLMDDHACDQHGWENVDGAQKRALAFADLAAKAHLAALDAAKEVDRGE